MEKHYTNGEVTIIWKPDLCIHSANCIRGLPDVFNNRARPWITPEGAETNAIIEQVKKCPSGALSYTMNDATTSSYNKPEPENLTAAAKLTGLANGPLLVEGSFEYYNAKGELIATKGKAFLCRCGQSSNKPFCDSSHKKVGFQAE